MASGTSQPGLHHHTLLHPPPAGKSPAAGWPLSTGLVLLHEMNRYGVGVGETRCGERSRGSGWLGVPGDGREQPAAELPASLALRALSTAVPQGLLDLALSPCQAAAAPPAPQTPPAMRACTFTLCHPLGFVPTPSQCLSVPRVCGWGGFALVEDGRSLKSHWHPHPNLSSTAQGAGRPAAPGETKPDLTRGNKYIKVKEKIEEALGRGECTGMRLSCPKNKVKRNPKHCSGPKQVKVKPATNSMGL